MNDIIHASDANFDSVIAGGSNAVIVDFWSPTCIPCRQMEPGLQELASTYAQHVKIVKVNVNESPRTSSRYMVRSLPTLLFMQGGLVRTQIIGATNTNLIERTLKEMLP
jgi:thioredoxin 1